MTHVNHRVNNYISVCLSSTGRTALKSGFNDHSKIIASDFNDNMEVQGSSKVYSSATAAIYASGLKTGDTLLAGGFGVCGIPMGLITAVRDSNVKELTLVSNNCGTDGWGNDLLLQNNQIQRIICSFASTNKAMSRKYLNGELEVEFVPQGTLAEKLRSAGAGIPAFYTRTGYGTWVETGEIPIKYNGNGEVLIKSEPKKTEIFNDEVYIREESIVGDVAIIKASQVDTFGNCRWKGSSQNFNPDCALAAKFTIVEADEIVPLGYFEPEDIHLSGAFIDAVIEYNAEKKIEILRNRAPDDINGDITGNSCKININEKQSKRDRIISRAAKELKSGMVVNLGIGMPIAVSNFIPPEIRDSVWLQTENGVLGIGEYPLVGEEDADLISAGKETITLLDGSSLFSSSTAFTMIRGGHIHCTILGALQVSGSGDIANWIVPGAAVGKGMGGAMDLVACGVKVIVLMEHMDKNGISKIVEQCSLPLTGSACVSMIITELAVFEIDRKRGLILKELMADDVTVEYVRECTACDFIVDGKLVGVKTLKSSQMQ